MVALEKQINKQQTMMNTKVEYGEKDKKQNIIEIIKYSTYPVIQCSVY